MSNAAWRYATVLLLLGLLAACGMDEGASTVRFAGSGETVSGAAVTPLVGSTDPSGDVTSFAIDPNTASTTTDEDGEFTLEYATVPESVGVQVTVAVDSVEGPAVGRLDWRGVIDPNANVELDVIEPRACEEGEECGTQLLPDLVPIIGWDDLGADTVERLEPQTNGPPSAGLFPAATWFVDDSDGRRLLRFATVAANLGDGPLDVIAAPGNGESAQTWQRIWTDTWHFEDRVSGEFIFHPTHDHIHFDAFEQYRLLNQAGEVVASSEKVSFCLRDSVRLRETKPAPTGPMLADDGECGDQQQVINAGFGDHYHALLDDQWIDITGVDAGTYTVEISVDPFNLIVESNEANNVGTFDVEIEG